MVTDLFADAALDAMAATEGLFTERGTYTPVSGDPIPNVLAQLRETDDAVGPRTQRRGWDVRFARAQIPTQPTDGATFVCARASVVLRSVESDVWGAWWDCKAQSA